MVQSNTKDENLKLFDGLRRIAKIGVCTSSYV